jgi:hypothetical protein
LADSGINEDRILVFGQDFHKTWSDKMGKIFLDGTFLLSPSLFSQIFVVLARKDGFVFPVLFALLPNKNTATYTRLFQLI